jgi:hypothetical protein
LRLGGFARDGVSRDDEQCASTRRLILILIFFARNTTKLLQHYYQQLIATELFERQQFLKEKWYEFFQH